MLYDSIYQTVLVRDFSSGGALQNYLHHLLASFGCGSGLYYGRFWGTVSNLCLVTEISTPFVNLRYLLYTHKKTDGTLYFVNGLSMTGVFFLSRIVYMGYCIMFFIPRVY